MTLDDLNRLTRKGRAAAAVHERSLRQAYAKAFVELGLEAAHRIERTATDVTAATDFHLPDADEVYDLLRAEALLHKRTDGIRVEIARSQMAASLASMGIRFDVQNPVVKFVLLQAGQKIQNISRTQREEIMSLLQAAHDDGLSIAKAAQSVASGVRGISATRAVTIARTEIVGVSNGGSLQVARLSGVAKGKVWLTAGGARHPRHELYDDLDGQTVGLSEQFNVGGSPLDYPGDPFGPPEEVINCRCTVAYET
jgi:hypothetical protein